MRSRAILSALLLSLFPLSAAFSGETTFQGEVGATGYSLDVNGGEGGRTKFTEHRDMKGPLRVLGTIGVKSDSESRSLRFNAYDMGYGTQRYHGNWGMHGGFGLDLSYDEIPHSIPFGARTFQSGAKLPK